jgi:mono/diheme cytochrome c family protein
MKTIIRIIIVVLVLGILYLAIAILSPRPQNPAVVSEPQWDSPRTRELAKRACFDCHSNETIWPWYTNIVPVSTLLRNDVQEGRAIMNFSEWNLPQEIKNEPGDVAEVILEGEMPLPNYLLMHPSARLTDQERQELAQGLQATFGR